MLHKFNVKCKTIKLLEKVIGGNLWNLGLGNIFLDLTANTQYIKGKNS